MLRSAWMPIADVPDAEDQEAALIRVQPAVRRTDPTCEIVKGGTTTVRQIIPKPREPPPQN